MQFSTKRRSLYNHAAIDPPMRFCPGLSTIFGCVIDPNPLTNGLDHQHPTRTRDHIHRVTSIDATNISHVSIFCSRHMPVSLAYTRSVRREACTGAFQTHRAMTYSSRFACSAFSAVVVWWNTIIRNTSPNPRHVSPVSLKNADSCLTTESI